MRTCGKLRGILLRDLAMGRNMKYVVMLIDSQNTLLTALAADPSIECVLRPACGAGLNYIHSILVIQHLCNRGKTRLQQDHTRDFRHGSVEGMACLFRPWRPRLVHLPMDIQMGGGSLRPLAYSIPVRISLNVSWTFANSSSPC